MADLNIPLKILSLERIAQNYFSIVFERPRGFTYEPGNWMDIRFPIPEFPVGKTYSFASSPTESNLRTAFKKGVSKFKKALEKVQHGDIMLITQYGDNGFLFDNHYQSIFFAEGIGITPFRSILKNCIDTNIKTDIDLIYLNHTDDFPFKNELDQWQHIYPYLRVHYIATGKEGRLTSEKILHLAPDITEKINYIVGPPGMVENTEKLLQALGIKQENIKTEKFEGY